MKQLFFLFSLVLLTSCGGGSGSDEPTPPPTPTPTVTNANKNDAFANAYLARLEMPKTKSGSKVVTHSTEKYGVTFSLEWDSKLQATRWVCWEMDASNKMETYSRPDEDPWAYDPNVEESEQQATYSELSNSFFPGYDPSVHKASDFLYQKGHICASQDRIYDKDANTQTFYMTNIYPMVGNFNGKLWSKMEKQVRTWGKNLGANDTLFIVKGGTIDKEELILDRTKEYKGHGPHIVPKYFFMALYAKTSSGQRMLGFWAEHLNEDKSGDALKSYVVSIDELEEKTGIDFFCNLSDTIEEQLESKTAADIISAWGL
jgi:endonuclease G